MTQIAIGHTPDQVSIWADIRSVDQNGDIHFHVINGAWDGVFKQFFDEGTVYVIDTQQSYPAHIIWIGDIGWNDYNKAIETINEQIADPEYRVDYTLMPPIGYSHMDRQKVMYGDDDDDIPF